MSDKRKYLVEAEVTISLHTVVEASSAAEAKRIAVDRALPRIDWPGRSDESTSAEEWDHSGEIDGIPKKLTARRYDDR